MRFYVSDCGPHVARGSAAPSEEPIGPFPLSGRTGTEQLTLSKAAKNSHVFFGLPPIDVLLALTMKGPLMRSRMLGFFFFFFFLGWGGGGGGGGQRERRAKG